MIIPVYRYKTTNGTYGDIESALPESGNLNPAQSPSHGIIRSNNDYTILMFEGDFIWLSEDGKYIIVAEFRKDDIINMISTEGRFTAGNIQNGTIQEAL